MDNKYVKLHSLLRMLGALLAIIIFVSMFIAAQVEDPHGTYDFRWSNGAFFGGDFCKGNVIAFFAYLFVFLAGLAGLAFVFIDEIIGKESRPRAPQQDETILTYDPITEDLIHRLSPKQAICSHTARKIHRCRIA